MGSQFSNPLHWKYCSCYMLYSWHLSKKTVVCEGVNLFPGFFFLCWLLCVGFCLPVPYCFDYYSFICSIFSTCLICCLLHLCSFFHWLFRFLKLHIILWLLLFFQWIIIHFKTYFYLIYIGVFVCIMSVHLWRPEGVSLLRLELQIVVNWPWVL